MSERTIALAATLAACALAFAGAVTVGATQAQADDRDTDYFVDVRDTVNQRVLEKWRHDAEKARAREVMDALAQAREAERAEQAEREVEQAAAAYDYGTTSYDYQTTGYGYTGGSTATTAHDLLNGQGRAYGEDGTSYTWYVHDLGYGPLDIPGENVDKDGVVHDGDGYIVVAADGHAKGDVLDTPYGKAKNYDSGSGFGNVDLYTNR